MSALASILEQVIDTQEEVSQVSTVPSPANTDEAVKMVLAGLRFIHANATAMVTEERHSACTPSSKSTR